MCDHLTAKDFDTDDVNATLAQLADKLQLTTEETELVDSVVMLYGSKSQNGLIFLTHAEQPWVEAREGLAPYQRSEREISLTQCTTTTRHVTTGIAKSNETQSLRH